jgi:hypothetical protein
MTEYRVVVEVSGIPSYDYFTELAKAHYRERQLKKQYPKGSKIFIQKRDITEWKNVSPR